MDHLDLITNHDGKPFPSPGMANWCRDLLHQATGRQYQVIQSQGGYFVALTVQSQDDGFDREQNRLPLPTVQYRQAIRSWILFCPWMMLWTVLIVSPDMIWSVVFALTHIKTLPNWVPMQSVLDGTASIGLALLGYQLVTILWSYYSERLLVTAQGIDYHSGIWARQTTSLRFQDIRSISMQQSVFQRVLGIGSLEFSSAGSDGVDVRFDNLANPVMIKQTIQHNCQSVV